MDINIVNTVKMSKNYKVSKSYKEIDKVLKEWRKVKGDLDDFIFYHEDDKILSER